MSRSNTNNLTAYCKVCQDAGKPETIYRSHYTRETKDPNSRVICPTLLALECRFCFKKGHTVKYCKILKEKDLQKPAPKPKNQTVTQKPAPKSTNAFSCLEHNSDDDDEEEMPQPVTVDAFPQLCTPPKTVQVTSNYAAALSKPVPKPEKALTIKLAPWISESYSVAPPPIRRPMTSWADDSDSEDEEDLIPVNLCSTQDEDW